MISQDLSIFFDPADMGDQAALTVAGSTPFNGMLFKGNVELPTKSGGVISGIRQVFLCRAEDVEAIDEGTALVINETSQNVVVLKSLDGFGAAYLVLR